MKASWEAGWSPALGRRKGGSRETGGEDLNGSQKKSSRVKWLATAPAVVESTWREFKTCLLWYGLTWR